MIEHPIAPLFDKDSKILILGSFPSVRSREDMFFYAHPQNRFWKVISSVFERDIPKTVEEKRRLLLSEHIALWDVVASCDISGSSDSSIRNVAPNDLNVILDNARIEKIFVNGKASEKYYNKYIRSETKQDAVYLPSTSPANASWTLERLIEQWSVIKSFCK